MSVTIAVDFDGTIVTHEFPKIGRPVPGALETLRDLLTQGHKLCLWTCRTGDWLKEAVQYLEDEGITLTGVNVNPHDAFDVPGPKMFAHTYIDDAALGVPLIIEDGTRRPFVNWLLVREHLTAKGWL